ncbi:MAG: oligosaccharide flippase family protein [Balneolaceae bacterium]|nr:oligosaccharide flippase family protein [Balneolaceae bacterium]
MGVIIRQSIQNTVIAYVGVLLGFVSTIILYPRVLTTDQYGLIQNLIALAMISTQFAHLGMKNTIIRYFPYFKETRTNKYGLLFLTIVIPLAGFLFFCVFFFLFDDQLVRYYTDQSQLFEQYYLFLVPLVGMVLYFEVLNSYVRALQDSVTGSFLNEVFIRFLVVVLLLLHWFGLFNFAWFIIFFVLIYSTQPVILLVYLFVKGELSMKIPFIAGRNWELAGKMFTYGIYTLLGGLTTTLVGRIDIIMLGMIASLGDSGIYAIAFYVGSVIETKTIDFQDCYSHTVRTDQG